MNITLYFDAPDLSPDKFEITINSKLVKELPVLAEFEGQTMQQFYFHEYSDTLINIYVKNKDTQQLSIYLLATDSRKNESLVKLLFKGPDETIQLSYHIASIEQEIGHKKRKDSFEKKLKKGKVAFKKPGHWLSESVDYEPIYLDFDHYDQTPPEKLISNVNKNQKNSVVEVFYATDRKKNSSDKKNPYTELRGTIKFGVCKVNIPKKKKQGEIPRPKWYKLEFSESPNKHMMIMETTEVRPNTFFKNLYQKVQSAPEQDAFVFVHGYNVNFEDSILRAAQIAKDINFLGAPIVYSWPSRAATLLYMSDEDNVQFTVSNIVQFLKDVKFSTKARKIHLIAHSMGNRALTKALIELQQGDFYEGFLFNQIILAAPDIDAQYFVKEIAPKIVHCSGRVTLYTSNKDRALKASEKIHGGILRTGLSSDEIVICEGIDTVDASKVDTDKLGHGYFASTAPLINDIYQITKNNHPPSERNLNEITSGRIRYWEFKEL